MAVDQAVRSYQETLSKQNETQPAQRLAELHPQSILSDVDSIKSDVATILEGLIAIRQEVEKIRRLIKVD